MGVLDANGEMSDCSLGWRDVVVRISHRRCWKRGALDGVGKCQRPIKRGAEAEQKETNHKRPAASTSIQPFNHRNCPDGFL